jgi:NhaP-type Na+/H+ or K+/H+ antiporter
VYESLAIVAAFAFVYSAIAGRIERSMLTGPIIFIAFGLLCGPSGIGILDINVDQIELRVVADITLALVLFIDAANADLSILRTNIKIPRRMLLVGMPLAILLGVVFGLYLFPDVSLFELCVLATILAATDAALGKGVITNKDVPPRIREGLNAESGLNDGLAVPILFVFLALATGTGGEQQDSNWLAITLVVRELGIGLIVGLSLTAVGATFARLCYDKGWFSDIWMQVLVVALALACFAAAQSLHGSGYIAAFVGGLLFGRLAGDSTHQMVQAGEGIGELLAMATWIMFGAAVVGSAWLEITWPVFVYSLLSLTVIRVLPMLVALIGSGESLESKLFLGWFGPRGLASIVFIIIVAGYQLPGFSILVSTVVCTVTMCVLAHGFSANAWARAFGRRSKSANGVVNPATQATHNNGNQE